MKFFDNPEPIDLGEGSEPVTIRLACIGRLRQLRYGQGMVISFHLDPATGDAIYRLLVFDIPSKEEQVALARKICAVEGAVSVDKGTGLQVDVEALRRSLTPEEFRLFCCLTNSREAGGSLTSYIGFAHLEGQEGHDSAFLDQEEPGNPTAGLGQFELEGITGEELHHILVGREFPTAPSS